MLSSCLLSSRWFVLAHGFFHGRDWRVVKGRSWDRHRLGGSRFARLGQLAFGCFSFPTYRQVVCSMGAYGMGWRAAAKLDFERLTDGQQTLFEKGLLGLLST